MERVPLHGEVNRSDPMMRVSTPATASNCVYRGFGTELMWPGGVGFDGALRPPCSR